MTSQEKEAFPLAGLRVLDLADEKAYFCSKLMAEMGAEVIKVERPGGDAARWIGPFYGHTPHPEKSLSFWYNNTNKLGITLNLESRKGRDIFLELTSRADVVVETFPPVYLEKIELGYEVLAGKNPRLILASVTGFGQVGPYKEYKSCDIVAAALGGQMYVCGAPDTPPLTIYGEQSFYAASLFAAAGILLALCERNRSGKGQHVDISLQEAVAATLEHVMVRYSYDGMVSHRQGNLHWTNSACLLPCKDGYILITFDREWDTLVELLESAGMAEDLNEERWCEQDYRRQHVDHVVEVLARWTRTHTKAELFDLGQLMRFPWAPVDSVDEVFNSPQLRARNFFVSVDHPEVDTSFAYPATPYKFSTLSPKVWRRAPLVGEDNVRVYHEELGFSLDEVVELRSANII